MRLVVQGYLSGQQIIGQGYGPVSGVSGTLALVEAPDVCSASNILQGPIAATEAPDIAAGSGAGTPSSGGAAIVERPDVISISGAVPAIGTGAVVEQPDIPSARAGAGDVFYVPITPSSQFFGARRIGTRFVGSSSIH
jgi:hypothetical protein